MSISKELNSAIIKSLTGKYLLYIIQIISLAILSRIFAPEMFGVIAVLQVILVFFSLVTTSSLAPAIVYIDNLTIKQRNGIFSFTFIVAVFLSIGLFFTGEYLILWLGLGNNEMLIYAMMIGAFFSTIAMLPVASLQKESKFLTIARGDIFAEVLSVCLCLFLVSYEFTLLALVVKFSTVPLFRFFFYYLSSKSTSIGLANFGKNISAIKVLFNFSKYQVLFNFVNYFSRNLDTILISKYFGVAVVGNYEKSYQVMKYPLQLFTFAITPALQPVLTKYKNNPIIIEREFYKVCYKLVPLGILASFSLFWAGSDVIYIMFGSQWGSVVPLISILSISIPIQMVLSSTGGVYQAFGQTKYQFYCGVWSSLVTILAIGIGVFYKNLTLLCILISVAFLINYIQCFYVLHKYVLKTFNRNKFYVLTLFAILPYGNIYFYVDNNELPQNLLSALDSLFVPLVLSIALAVLSYQLMKKLVYTRDC